MKYFVNFFGFIALLFLSAGHLAYAQNPIATTSSAQLKECVSQRKKYRTEASECMKACRIRDNAGPVRIQHCQDAYNAYRKATGQSVAVGTSPETKSFMVEAITAQFSVRNGRLNQFRLIGKHSEREEYAAKVCIFQLPPVPLFGQKGSPFKEKVLAFRKQDKGFAYRLSGITWSEDGRSQRYPCKVDAIDVVAVD